MGVILDVSHVSFGYRGGPRLLEDISFTVAAGEVLCMLGPNGAGKSTLLRCLLGFYRVDAGCILLQGIPLDLQPRRTVARAIVYVPQSSASSFPFRVLDMVLMGRTPHIDVAAVASGHDEGLADLALERVGIGHLRERSFDEVSGGERQLVLIARALCQDARLIVMDEPTASLDYGNQLRILRIVNELRAAGYAIVMTAHNPEHAFLGATQAAILKGGRIRAWGTPAAVITSESLSDLYSTRVAVFNVPRPDDPATPMTACLPLLDR